MEQQAPETGPPSGSIYTPVVSSRNSFMAGGVEYFIETPHQQGIRRKVAFTKESVRVAFGTGIEGLIAEVARAVSALNIGPGKDRDVVKASYHLQSLIYKAASVDELYDEALMLCTLFINTKDEDRRQVPSDDDRQQKIETWADAGIAYPFFVGLLKGFNSTLGQLFESFTPTSAETAASPKHP